MARRDLSRRTFLKAGGALVVGLGLGESWPGPAGAQTLPGADRFVGKALDPKAVDAFLAVHADGTVTVFSGRVDLGPGARAALRQLVGEERDLRMERIALIEGDTALTPDVGGTGGSYGISRGGQQLQQAAATARQALLGLAAQRLGRAAADLEVEDGVVRPKGGGPGVSYGELIGDRPLGVPVDPKAPVKDPASYRLVGQRLPRPDIPAKVTGHHRYLHDLVLPGMLHARVLRPPAPGATLRGLDESSIASIAGARAVRLGSFVAVVAEREWDAVRASRLLKTEWSPGTGLPDHAMLYDTVRGGQVAKDEVLVKRGDLAALSPGTAGVRVLTATYQWPIQTHGSLGPSCGVADVKADRATIWTASQASFRFRAVMARVLGMPPERLRVIYLDGAGSYGQNGADDASCDAALLSKAVGRPVRVQW